MSCAFSVVCDHPREQRMLGALVILTVSYLAWLGWPGCIISQRQLSDSYNLICRNNRSLLSLGNEADGLQSDGHHHSTPGTCSA